MSFVPSLSASPSASRTSLIVIAKVPQAAPIGTVLYALAVVVFIGGVTACVCLRRRQSVMEAVVIKDNVPAVTVVAETAVSEPIPLSGPIASPEVNVTAAALSPSALRVSMRKKLHLDLDAAGLYSKALSRATVLSPNGKSVISAWTSSDSSENSGLESDRERPQSVVMTDVIPEPSDVTDVNLLPSNVGSSREATLSHRTEVTKRSTTQRSLYGTRATPLSPNQLASFRTGSHSVSRKPSRSQLRKPSRMTVGTSKAALATQRSNQPAEPPPELLVRTPLPPTPAEAAPSFGGSSGYEFNLDDAPADEPMMLTEYATIVEESEAGTSRPPSAATPALTVASEQALTVQAIADVDAQPEHNIIGFRAGDWVTVVSADGDWLYGSAHGQWGYFLSASVQQ
jgi:hypothetical protein